MCHLVQLNVHNRITFFTSNLPRNRTMMSAPVSFHVGAFHECTADIISLPWVSILRCFKFCGVFPWYRNFDAYIGLLLPQCFLISCPYLNTRWEGASCPHKRLLSLRGWYWSLLPSGTSSPSGTPFSMHFYWKSTFCTKAINLFEPVFGFCVYVFRNSAAGVFNPVYNEYRVRSRSHTGYLLKLIAVASENTSRLTAALKINGPQRQPPI